MRIRATSRMSRTFAFVQVDSPVHRPARLPITSACPESAPFIMPSWYHDSGMAFPIRVCAVCSEEFELKPDKPGFANRCPACSVPEAAADPKAKVARDADERKSQMEANEARRAAMRDLLYRKDS
jgi:hypothetical protein